MIRLLFYLLFILSVAFTAGSVIISSKLRDRYRDDTFSPLMYYQVFIFTFGFYGIWAIIFISEFLAPYIATDVISRFTDLAVFLGLPFLVFAWLMLIRFSAGISGRKISNWLGFWFLLVNFSILILVGFLITRSTGIKPSALTRNYFIVMNFVCTIVSVLMILYPGKGPSLINNRDRKTMVPVLLFIMLAQNIPLLLYTTQVYIAMGFIFAFFAGNSFLPVYLNYGTLIASLPPGTGDELTLDAFCSRYEVSPRETEIIREICNGLSNKEISEKLFISLQTVKDHTHRIYVKTNVRSRVQLMNLVRELLKNEN